MERRHTHTQEECEEEEHESRWHAKENTSVETLFERDILSFDKQKIQIQIQSKEENRTRECLIFDGTPPQTAAMTPSHAVLLRPYARQ